MKLRILKKNNRNNSGNEDKPKFINHKVVSGKTLDFYAITPPYSYVMIIRDEEGSLRYHVIEPVLTEEEHEWLMKIKERAIDAGWVTIDVISMDYVKAIEYMKNIVRKAIRYYGHKLKRERKITEAIIGKYAYYLARDIVGYGKIDVMYRDPNVEDIICDGVDIPVYVFHRVYEWLKSNIVFETPEELDSFIRRLAFRAGQSINYARPIIEGPLPPEGYRAHITLDVVSRRGSTFTIRKYSELPYTIVDLLKFHTLDPLVAAYLWLLIDHINSMLITGAMASGKTTLLNAIAMLIRPEVKIVTVEETPEIRLFHENWVPMVVRPSFEPGVQDITLFDLLKSALRQRPDYIIVGEIRGEEAYTFFQAISVGHGGLGTIHGETIEATIRRLITRPMNVPPMLIPLVKAFVLMGKVKTPRGLVRRVIEIREPIEVNPETGEVKTNLVFKWDAPRDSWIFTGKSLALRSISERTFKHISEIYKDLERRATIMKWILEKRVVKSYHDLAKILREYYANPERVSLRAEVEVEPVVIHPKPI